MTGAVMCGCTQNATFVQNYHMKVELHRISGDYHLQAVNEDGNTIDMDASPDIGGTSLGMRPMQTLLSALGACTSIDVILILKKKRQNLRDIKVTVTGDREEEGVPAIYTKIHVHFDLYGDIDPAKAERAMELSNEKYCSVTHMVNKVADVTWSYEIHE